MIYANVELHNVAEVTPANDSDGVRLQRVPEEVRQRLNEGAQAAMLSPALCEIRFVNEGPSVKVTLSSEGESEFTVFWGVFQERERYVATREPRAFEFFRPERLALLKPEHYTDMPFAPAVCRLMLGGNPVVLHTVEGEGLRPPTVDEVPSLRYLAYGTSITQGAAASRAHLSYAAQTARHLGADLINLGVGGSAFCEFELADHIAGHTDWHIASLALSVNMINKGFSHEEFYERVAYMVDKVAGADTNRPVACITIYPYFRDLTDLDLPEDNPSPRVEGFRQKLRDAVAAAGHPNLHLIEGPDILQGVHGLTPDLLHPGDNGMIQMGENLARKLKPLLKV